MGLSSVNACLARALEKLLVALFALLVADVLWGVFTRYVLGGQARWSEELARLLMVWLALMGAALVSREDRHLGLDLLVRQWPPRIRRQAALFRHACVAVFAALVLFWGGLEMTLERFASGQTLPALNLSKAWFYAALPTSGLLMLLFSLESIWRELRAAQPAPESEGGPSA